MRYGAQIYLQTFKIPMGISKHSRSCKIDLAKRNDIQAQFFKNKIDPHIKILTPLQIFQHKPDEEIYSHINLQQFMLPYLNKVIAPLASWVWSTQILKAQTLLRQNLKDDKLLFLHAYLLPCLFSPFLLLQIVPPSNCPCKIGTKAHS